MAQQTKNNEKRTTNKEQRTPNNKQRTPNKEQGIKIRPGTEWNFSYYPIVFESEESLLFTEKKLKENNIIPRRYFYPSLHHLPYVTKQNMPISESVAKRILCLPHYHNIKSTEIEIITMLINNG